MLLSKHRGIICLVIGILLIFTGIVGVAEEKGEIPGGPIKIGFAVPMSGVATSLSAKAGVKANLAAEYMNKYEDGILGRKVKPIVYDSKADPKVTVQVVGKLVEQDNVEAVLACLSSGTGLAIANKVEKEWKVPTLLLESTTMDMFTKTVPDPKYLFRVGPDDVMQSATHVEAVLQRKPNVKTIAIGAPDYEWGHDVVERFKAIMKELQPGVEFVYTFFHPLGEASPNFAPHISKVLKKDPDVYVGYSWGTDAVAWDSQAKAMGLYDKIPLVFNVFSGTARGKAATEGLLTESRAGNGMYPPHELGYPNSKFTPMIFEKVGVLPTYGMGIHMLTGLLYLDRAYEKAYSLTGEYPSGETIAEVLEGLTIKGPCGITSMVNHQSTAPGMTVGTLKKENGKWLLKDKIFIPPAYETVPSGLSVEEFIDLLGELRK